MEAAKSRAIRNWSPWERLQDQEPQQVRREHHRLLQAQFAKLLRLLAVENDRVYCWHG